MKGNKYRGDEQAHHDAFEQVGEQNCHDGDREGNPLQCALAHQGGDYLFGVGQFVARGNQDGRQRSERNLVQHARQEQHAQRENHRVKYGAPAGLCSGLGVNAGAHDHRGQGKSA